jgi:hypothetical protein
VRQIAVVPLELHRDLALRVADHAYVLRPVGCTARRPRCATIRGSCNLSLLQARGELGDDGFSSAREDPQCDTR